MTSTILSGKTFPKLYKWALRRNRAIIIVFAVLMALGIVIDLYAMSQFVDYSYYTNNEAARYRQFAQIGFYSIIAAQVGAIVLSIISALH